MILVKMLHWFPYNFVAVSAVVTFSSLLVVQESGSYQAAEATTADSDNDSLSMVSEESDDSQS